MYSTPGVTYYFDDPSLEYDTLDTTYADAAATAARINAYRKGTFNVRFLGANGQPLSASRLSAAGVSFKRHDFPFGAAFDPSQVRCAASRPGRSEPRGLLHQAVHCSIMIIQMISQKQDHLMQTALRMHRMCRLPPCASAGLRSRRGRAVRAATIGRGTAVMSHEGAMHVVVLLLLPTVWTAPSLGPGSSHRSPSPASSSGTRTPSRACSTRSPPTSGSSGEQGLETCSR